MIKPYYEENGITIYHGDCRDILPEVEQVDAVITDPPYGLGYQYLSYEDTEEKLAELVQVFVPLCRTKARLTAVSCGIVNLQKYPVADWTMAITWNTTGSRGKFGFNQWMAILLYGKDRHDFDRMPGVIKSDVIFENGGGSVGFQRCGEKENHPCPKPIGLMKKLISRLSVGTVVDPFMGSGTTLLAAKDMGRRAIGIEIEEKYCEIAVKRLAQGVLDFAS
jgi:site-specific DNA-methyltransferase (adenine-specific)